MNSIFSFFFISYSQKTKMEMKKMKWNDIIKIAIGVFIGHFTCLALIHCLFS